MGGDYCQKFFIYLFYSHKNYNEGWWADYEGTAFVKNGRSFFPWIWYPVVLHKPRSRQRGMVS